VGVWGGCVGVWVRVRAIGMAGRGVHGVLHRVLLDWIIGLLNPDFNPI